MKKVKLIQLAVLAAMTIVVAACVKEELLSPIVRTSDDTAFYRGDAQQLPIPDAPPAIDPLHDWQHHFTPDNGNNNPDVGNHTPGTPPTTLHGYAWEEYIIPDGGGEPVQPGAPSIGSDSPQLPVRNALIAWTNQVPNDGQWIHYQTKQQSADYSKTGISAQSSPGDDCNVPDCDVVIAQAVAYYQPIANQFCRDIYTCVTCCYDGYVVCALLWIRHNCGIIPNPVDE